MRDESVEGNQLRLLGTAEVLSVDADYLMDAIGNVADHVDSNLPGHESHDPWIMICDGDEGSGVTPSRVSGHEVRKVKRG